MKNSNIFWGVFLLTIGGLWLTDNINPLNLYISTLWDYWPVLLIIIGVSFLIKHTFARFIITGLIALLLGIWLFAGINSFTDIWSDHDDINISWDDEEYDRNNDTLMYSAAYSKDAEYAVLNVEGGAGAYRIFSDNDSTTFEDSLMMQIFTKGRQNYEFKRSDKKNITVFDVSMEDNVKHHIKSLKKHKLTFAINDTPIWDFNFKVGASSLDLDLSKYKVKSLDIDMGASDVEVKLGSKYDNTFVKIESGATSTDIMVPEESGCEIRADLALSSKNFENFNKIDDKTYRTENFETAKNKIYIELNSGVSSFNVSRYPDENPVKTEKKL